MLKQNGEELLKTDVDAIDQEVYQLYGLSEEEIALID